MAILSPKVLNYFYFGREQLARAVFSLLSLWPVKIYLALLFILNLITWLLAFFLNKSVSQNLVVLHYNVNLGVDLIGNISSVFIIPTLGLLFVIINFLLLLNLQQKSKFLIHLLLGFSALINLFLIAAIFTVYIINFR